jgi:cyclopropane-fatty-acyl-phospholipid synthase
MLYKFKSKNASDLVMLGADGRRLLSILGKDASAPTGIIVVEQLDQAMADLAAAVVQDEAARQADRAAADADGRERPVEPEVSLRQRAAPLSRMLHLSKEAGVPVVWGV